MLLSNENPYKVTDETNFRKQKCNIAAKITLAVTKNIGFFKIPVPKITATCSYVLWDGEPNVAPAGRIMGENEAEMHGIEWPLELQVSTLFYMRGFTEHLLSTGYNQVIASLRVQNNSTRICICTVVFKKNCLIQLPYLGLL